MSARSDYRTRVVDQIKALRARSVEHAPEAAESTRSGLSVVNATGDDTVLRIYDEISYWGINALDVIGELDNISADRIRVEINSPGGDVFDGIAIHNALRSHPAHITTRVDGLAASIASVIAQAGDDRVMQPAAQMMIHNAWGLVVGDRNDHSEMADLLAQQDEVIAGMYAARSGRELAEFRDLMDAETWLTDQATVDLGLADSIQSPPAAVADRLARIDPAVVESVRGDVARVTDAIADADDPDIFSQIAANAQRRRR